MLAVIYGRKTMYTLYIHILFTFQSLHFAWLKTLAGISLASSCLLPQDASEILPPSEIQTLKGNTNVYST